MRPDIVFLGGSLLLLGATASPIPSRSPSPLPPDDFVPSNNPTSILSEGPADLNLFERGGPKITGAVCHDHRFTTKNVKDAIKKAKEVHEEKKKDHGDEHEEYGEYPMPLDKHTSGMFKDSKNKMLYPLEENGAFDGKGEYKGKVFVVVDKHFKYQAVVQYNDDHAYKCSPAEDKCQDRDQGQKEGDESYEWPKALDPRATHLYKNGDKMQMIPLSKGGAHGGKSKEAGPELAVLNKDQHCKGAVRLYDKHGQDEGHGTLCFAQHHKKKVDKNEQAAAAAVAVGRASHSLLKYYDDYPSVCPYLGSFPWSSSGHCSLFSRCILWSC
ncbi:uncharacterized protein BO97DRAFT_424458 [Aspergillus homomorphus CBS 101889]|uniref:Uncharacterized protein n=1 Tax=Aspergillus homomorphus (strain CBS 101889) TaxID=1450537 RepID=A0A395HXW3_ASPHC|nr:hypothetical protein BO97DRAFT_424458 [Aspergillus homomorphus CBS 101889]RAL12366.1 hypothetical protein BO97DRAFT_424458 [Aspergillus homomorphus CBS 101889]